MNHSRRSTWLLTLTFLGLSIGSGWLWFTLGVPPLKAPSTPLTAAQAPAPEGGSRSRIPTPRVDQKSSRDTSITERKNNASDRSTRISIPAINVNARVQPLGTNAAGELNAPARYQDVGRWAAGPKPGARGASVLAGHVDSKTGPAVFWDLRELTPGDAVLVNDSSGKQHKYQVMAARQYAKNNFPTKKVYPRTKKRLLRLITCGGVFDRATGHYRDNYVVFARLVS